MHAFGNPEEEMQYFQSYHEFGSCSNQNNSLDGGPESQDAINDGNSNLETEARAMEARDKHRVAERDRRKRTNCHYSTLRNLLPNATKLPKASVLARVIRRLTELREAAAELWTRDEGDGTEELLFPGETNELRLGRCEGEGEGEVEGEGGVVKAMLNCEDRAELLSEVSTAVRSVGGRVVRAEMVTVGGWTKCLLWVHGLGQDGLEALRRALKVVVDRPSFFCGSGRGFRGNKRIRFSH
ncbi:hypothetical protein PVL29_026648 [Vitis rotundifolia]|uniref:BHLH domain-containing protein n=1 Tax=Vitis rotundifolia TaxID=103349 RepID=A0AA39D3X4_VITRO|nr:hypothetical protein PVL29_026648 [Vitis rotundifolia]